MDMDGHDGDDRKTTRKTPSTLNVATCSIHSLTESTHGTPPPMSVDKSTKKYNSSKLAVQSTDAGLHPVEEVITKRCGSCEPCRRKPCKQCPKCAQRDFSSCYFKCCEKSSISVKKRYLQDLRTIVDQPLQGGDRLYANARIEHLNPVRIQFNDGDETCGYELPLSVSISPLNLMAHVSRIPGVLLKLKRKKSPADFVRISPHGRYLQDEGSFRK